jgi:hypothetical protein
VVAGEKREISRPAPDLCRKMKKDATRPDILHPSFDRERGACPAALWRCPSTASAALAAALHRPLVARNGETSREARPGLENSLWPFCFSLVTRIALPLTSQSHGNPASAVLLCTPRQSNMAFVLSDAGRSNCSSVSFRFVSFFHTIPSSDTVSSKLQIHCSDKNGASFTIQYVDSPQTL